MTKMISQKQSQPWWRNAVIYQIYPRSFLDSSGDGIGDLSGIIKKLDYVASLGVDAIWISPFFKSPMKDYSYDVSDYEKVDPLFGDIDDFDKLVEKSHSLGIKVIIDQVISHTSDQHEWFKESRSSKKNSKADWYVWADARKDGSPPNNWLSIFGGSAWHWDTRRQQYYFHNFLKEQPDLNFHNPQVRKAVLSTMEFWLKRKVDGFRLDTANFYFHSRTLKNNPPNPSKQTFGAPPSNPYGFQRHLYDKTQKENIAFLKELRKLIDTYSTPGNEIMTVGEIGDNHETQVIADYTKGKDRLHTCYGFAYLSNFFSAEYFKKKIIEFEKIVKEGWVCWSFSNHDVVRVVTRWGSLIPAFKKSQEKDLAKMLLAIEISLKGMICLYQGEELALTEAEIPFEKLHDPYGIEMYPAFKGRDGCRTPMVWKKNHPQAGFSSNPQTWLPIPKEHLNSSVDVQEKDKYSVLNFTRQLLQFKKDQPALKGGIKVLSDDQMIKKSILMIERKHEKERLCLVANLSTTKQSIDLKAWGKKHPEKLFSNRSQLTGFKLTLDGLGFAFIK